ncbi:hypothetical protein CDD83_8437 [Cordyceps sp. RAO-2017]|nr:hypothetical protein CDD83_8437 [Cordyceps sp. RAO-2017]
MKSSTPLIAMLAGLVAADPLADLGRTTLFTRDDPPTPANDSMKHLDSVCQGMQDIKNNKGNGTGFQDKIDRCRGIVAEPDLQKKLDALNELIQGMQKSKDETCNRRQDFITQIDDVKKKVDEEKNKGKS